MSENIVKQFKFNDCDVYLYDDGIIEIVTPEDSFILRKDEYELRNKGNKEYELVLKDDETLFFYGKPVIWHGKEV